MFLALSRSGEDVSDFTIGKFGDTRLAKIGALFFKRLFEKLTISICYWLRKTAYKWRTILLPNIIAVYFYNPFSVCVNAWKIMLGKRRCRFAIN